jgi:hypothetical protein
MGKTLSQTTVPTGAGMDYDASRPKISLQIIGQPGRKNLSIILVVASYLNFQKKLHERSENQSHFVGGWCNDHDGCFMQKE